MTRAKASSDIKPVSECCGHDRVRSKVESKFQTESLSTFDLTLFPAVIIVACLASCRPVATLPKSESDPVANRVAALVTAGDQQAILDNFYYPEATEGAQAEDRASVGRILSILYSDFGSIRELSRSKAVPTALDLTVSPGTLEQLNQEGSFKRYFYDAKFANYGQGFVYIDVLRHHDGSVGLRSLAFSLPIGRLDSAARIGTTGRRMFASLK
jgi:hypothetical protein